MDRINKIKVSLLLMGENYEVGEMVLSERKIYFKYNTDFLNTGLNISPIKLPFSDRIVAADLQPFEGLFGVFDDSLPDGWGRLLFDRFLQSKGVDRKLITPLDRLAYVGASGKGALIYEPGLDPAVSGEFVPELEAIAAEAGLILQGESSSVIDELMVLGGSSGGARPKIFVAYNPVSGDIIYGAQEIPERYEEWIVKFSSSVDSGEIANIEYAYSMMAKAAEIEMTECRLFRSESGKTYFGTKRFDRIDGKRIHVHTAAGIMHDNFRMSSLDYGHLMDCAFRLERHVHAYEKVFRLAVFNVYAHNRDDHSKNFSFLMDGNGEWRFAPAYDLTFSSSGFGLHSTMVAGESKNPGRQHLLKLASHFGVKNAEAIIEQVQIAISRWEDFAFEAGVSKQTTYDIRKSLNNLRDR